jgi:hypothetical protein
MDDVTPLNLEDSPKLFGMRFDQLIWILVSFVAFHPALVMDDADQPCWARH